MSEVRPSVVVLAGPNGAGKSTTAPALLQGTLGVTEFVNADDSFARTRSPVAVLVWPIRSTIVSKVRRARPRQFVVM